MVDAPTQELRRGRETAAALPQGWRADCAGGPAALASYRDFCHDADFSPSQSPHWVECWARNVNPDIVVARLLDGDRPLLALALEVVPDGIARLARFPGGSHANGNFPALAGAVDPGAAPLLFPAIARARPDIDLVGLERMAERLGRHESPLASLPRWQSPNPALAVDLAGGFDAVLDRASGKRKRKKHRSQTRKFEAAGGHGLVRAQGRDETGRLLDAFFAMKAIRFEAMGLRNVFAAAEVQAFFRDLFGSDDGTRFVLDALEVGGRLRAVTGCSLTPTSTICEFGAIAEDDLAFASPGEFLFFESIHDACRKGYAHYDFSVGDEAYKRLWCDVETWQFDVVQALSARGAVARLVRRAGARAKRLVKSNAVLWEGVRRLRRSPRKQEPADAE